MSLEFQHFKVLIVDDHPINRILLSSQLKQLGCYAEEALDARHALELLNTCKFDIVITDCNMPDISGFELAQLIRRSDIAKEMYIVGYTIMTENDVENKCINAGMNDCIFKPVSLNDLCLMFKRFKLSSENIISIESIIEIVDGDRDILKVILKKIQMANSKDKDDLIISNDNLNVKCLKKISHRIKGAAMIVKAERLQVSCDKLLQVDFEDKKYMSDFVADIVNEINVLDKFIEEFIFNNLSDIK